MIVSTDWLAKHLNDDGRSCCFKSATRKNMTPRTFRARTFIQLSDISTPRGQGLILELPSVDELKATFEKFGVTDNSRIVVYFSKDWVTPTSARLFHARLSRTWAIALRFSMAALPAWQRRNVPSLQKCTRRRLGSFTPACKYQALVVDAAWVSANLNKPGVAILDARAAKFYTGETAGQCHAPDTFLARRAFHSRPW
jgi:3-mercaptopyruvate sulfurtransferase SseA